MWYGANRNPAETNLWRIGHATAPCNPCITGLFEVSDIVLPGHYVLRQNYPNPFNPSTTIEFSLPKTEFVTLKIYNLLGQEVEELVAKRLTPGNYTYSWNAGLLSSGVYIYRIQAGAFQEVRKMIYLK